MQLIKQFLKEASYADLHKAIEMLNAEVAARAEEERKKAEVLEFMRAQGLSLNDFIDGGKASSDNDKRSKVKAKYRIVVDGEELEWSGRGRTPKAFVGKDLSQYLID